MRCHKIQKPTKVCKYETSGEPKFHPGSSTPVKFVPRCNIVVKCQHRRCELFRGGTSAIANQGSRFAFFYLFFILHSFAQSARFANVCNFLQFCANFAHFAQLSTLCRPSKLQDNCRQLQTSELQGSSEMSHGREAKVTSLVKWGAISRFADSTQRTPVSTMTIPT